MEFIQCPHCKKQYAVSDKLRAAAGKKIRCKHCSQPFEIIVQIRSTQSQTEPEKSTASTEATGPEVAPRKEKQTTAPAMPEPAPVVSTLSEQTPSNPAESPALKASPADHENDDLFDLSKYNSESYYDSSETTLEQESEQDVALPDASEATAIDAPDETAETDEGAKKAAPKTEPVKKTFNIQLLITIVLAITLLVAAVAAFLFLTQPELFRATAKKETQSIVTEELFKPIEIKIADPKPEAITKEKVIESAPVAAPKPAPNAIQLRAKAFAKTPVTKKKPKPAKEFKPSQVCKDVSAEYWVRSHTLATASLDTKTYMKLLDQNLVQADEIRSACKDKTLVGIISKAARTDNRLDWIKHEINVVLDKTDTVKKSQFEE